MENLQVSTSNNAVEVKKMSAFQRIAGVFFSPTEVMKNLAEKPKILLPLTLMIAAPLVLLISRYGAYIDWLRQTTAETYEKMGNQITAEQLEAILKVSGPISIASAAIAIPIFWLIGTAVLFGLVKAFKGEGKFKQYLSVTAHAGLIMILFYFVMGIVSLFTGTLDLKSSVTSLGSLLPDGMKSGFLYGALQAIEIFTLWEYAVIAIGVTQVSKLSSKKVYGIIGGIYTAYVLYSGVGQLIAGLMGAK